jgi:hypothetical protein
MLSGLGIRLARGREQDSRGAGDFFYPLYLREVIESYGLMFRRERVDLTRLIYLLMDNHESYKLTGDIEPNEVCK